MRDWDRKRAVLVASAVVYGAALFLPGLAASGPNPYGFTDYNGFACLIWGPTTILGGLRYFVPGTANIAYVLALVMWGGPVRHRRWFVVFPLIAMALAATTWRIDSVLVNEAGHRAAVHPGAGGLGVGWGDGGGVGGVCAGGGA